MQSRRGNNLGGKPSSLSFRYPGRETLVSIVLATLIQTQTGWPPAKCYAEWRCLNSSILTLAFSFVSSTDWLTFARLWAAFSEAACLCDSWICLAASLASPQVSFAAPLACLTTPLLASFSLPTLSQTLCSTLPTA